MNRFSLNPLFSKFLIVIFILTICWMVFMRYETMPLTSEEIVRFEFAGNPENVKAILGEWDNKEWIPLAKHSIYLDFIFIFLYTSTLALGCLTFPSLTERLHLMTWGLKLYRFSLYAGLADFLENSCLLEILYGSQWAFFSGAAWAFAFVKFSIIVVVLLFLIRCIIQWVVSRSNA